MQTKQLRKTKVVTYKALTNSGWEKREKNQKKQGATPAFSKKKEKVKK